MAVVTFRVRGDNVSDWVAANPVLKNGEPGYTTDALLVKYGDGATAWNALPYANAFAATKLLTPRTINGVPFDGSANITIPVGGNGTVTSFSFTNANGVSGSVSNANTTPNLTITLGVITPASVAASGTVTGSNLSGTNTGDQTTITGNAGTATKWQTPRTVAISGAVTGTATTLDGTANVTIPITALDVGAATAGTLAVARGGTGDTGSAWTAYTPTATAGAGSFGSVSAAGRYKTLGKTVFVVVTVTITTNGTASSFFNVTLPFTSIGAIQHMSGNENQAAGFMVVGSVLANSTTLQVQKYDASYPGGSGYRITLEGVYEAG